MGYRARKCKQIDSFLELTLEDFKAGKIANKDAISEIRTFLGRDYFRTDATPRRAKVICTFCEKDFWVLKSDYKRNKSKEFFCSIDCRTKYRNSIMNENQEAVWDCLLDNGILTTNEVSKLVSKSFTTVSDSLKKLSKMGLTYSKKKGKYRRWYIHLEQEN